MLLTNSTHKPDLPLAIAMHTESVVARITTADAFVAGNGVPDGAFAVEAGEAGAEALAGVLAGGAGWFGV